MPVQIDILRLSTNQLDINLYRTWWLWGPRKQGTVDVFVPDSFEKKDVVAEIAAMHYLLEEYRVAGDTSGGANTKIICSFGAIKKASKGQSNFRELNPLSIFLKCMFSESDIEISKVVSSRRDNALVRAVKITAKSPLSTRIKNHNKEWFELSMHALERMMQRWNMSKEEGAWRKLMYIFGDPNTKEYETIKPEDKIERYFYNDIQNVLFISKDNNIVTVVYPKDITYLKKREMNIRSAH